MTSSSYNFIASSMNNCFNLSISQSIMDKLLAICDKADDVETGGILIGYYDTNREWAIVTEATEPPQDSRSDSNWFFRGIIGLQNKLFKLWPRQKYYLGEWHYHPHGAAIPSRADINQMESISTSTKYNCPEPILAILGEKAGEFEIKVYVFVQNDSVFELVETAKQ